MPDLFDRQARRQRRDRAARVGGGSFIERRAMEEMVERLATVARPFDRALLIGALDAGAADLLRASVAHLKIVDPSPEVADARGGELGDGDDIDGPLGHYDLVVAAGTLATVERPGDALLRLRLLLKPDGLLIGYVPGNILLPRLSSAMRAATADATQHTPHLHPRLDPAGLATLLSAAGFAMPVVDIERLRLCYASLDDLVRDLRAAGATNILASRSRAYLNRSRLDQARQAFMQGAVDGRVEEHVELLHFSAWNPASIEI